MWTSAEQVPSLHGVAPRYLKVVTSSNVWPFMLISALMLFMLLVMILLFFCADFHSICRCSVYESIGEVLEFTLAAALKVDVGKVVGCIWAFHKMAINAWWSWSVSCMIISGNKLNRMGESMNP